MKPLRRRLSVTVLALALILLTSACVTPDMAGDGTSDNLNAGGSSSAGQNAADLSMAVPGYQVGEIPPVPLITMPDLSLLKASKDAFTLKFTEISNTYPGLTVTPVRRDRSGTRVTAGGAVFYQSSGGSSSYISDSEKIIRNSSGSGSYEGNGIKIIVNSSGSGSFEGYGVKIIVNSSGSGSYESPDEKIIVNSSGSGSYEGYGKKIVVNSSGSGSYESPDEKIMVNSSGSGSYSGHGLTIVNNGRGEATVTGPQGTLQVAADPLPMLPLLERFPLLDTLQPQELTGISITLDSALLFDYDKYTLRPEASEVIATLAQALKENNVPAAEIEGHTDSMGSDTYNQTLSENRAKAVLDALSAAGVTAKMDAAGYGESRPVAPNTTEDGKDNPGGRQLNRRVEIFIPVF